MTALAVSGVAFSSSPVVAAIINIFRVGPRRGPAQPPLHVRPRRSLGDEDGCGPKAATCGMWTVLMPTRSRLSPRSNSCRAALPGARLWKRPVTSSDGKLAVPVRTLRSLNDQRGSLIARPCGHHDCVGIAALGPRERACGDGAMPGPALKASIPLKVLSDQCS